MGPGVYHFRLACQFRGEEEVVIWEVEAEHKNELRASDYYIPI